MYNSRPHHLWCVCVVPYDYLCVFWFPISVSLEFRSTAWIYFRTASLKVWSCYFSLLVSCKFHCVDCVFTGTVCSKNDNSRTCVRVCEGTLEISVCGESTLFRLVNKDSNLNVLLFFFLISSVYNEGINTPLQWITSLFCLSCHTGNIFILAKLFVQGGIKRSQQS